MSVCGLMIGTRESAVLKIAKTGLLRVGHPLNPSKSTDPGWFGSPKHGIYLARNADYSLKYCNDLAPLRPEEAVKLLMFKVVRHSFDRFHRLISFLRRCLFPPR